MKVRLTEKVELIIEPENAAEALALRFWTEGFNPIFTDGGGKSKMCVITEVQPQEAYDGQRHQA